MDFFCIPFIFGCKETISPEDQTARLCPRCNNASVCRAHTRQWLELCFIPVIPMSSKSIWACSICQWRVTTKQSWEPMVAGMGPPPGHGGYHGPPMHMGPPQNAPPPHGWPQAPQPSWQQSPQHSHGSPPPQGYRK